ncbi:hypothetical protein COLO4_13169 [Corchorus olitorius]|uniref:Uncharacterized protein n=1 Tax=Corchorus olitorius TaxID=93759 RepID=A0A1R3JXX2_9ROSI|nr:hypothetical protein COLO4_13169 [Corchorus olitorius]
MAKKQFTMLQKEVEGGVDSSGRHLLKAMEVASVTI